jgi:hypothetical protein
VQQPDAAATFISDMDTPETLAGLADHTLSGTAVVTGSTRGVGRETALALGRLGADVVVHGRDVYLPKVSSNLFHR